MIDNALTQKRDDYITRCARVSGDEIARMDRRRPGASMQIYYADSETCPRTGLGEWG